MEEDNDDKEAIPLDDVPEPGPLAPTLEMSNTLSDVNEAVTQLQKAIQQVRGWMAELHEWELLEPAAGDVLAFAHRHEPGLFRVAGRLRTPAAMVIAKLKDHSQETRTLWDTDVERVECLASYGDNMERVRSVVRMPFKLAPVTIEGIQHTTFTEQGSGGIGTYFYIFASSPPSAGDAHLITGVTVRELDKQTGCEINAVFQCEWDTHWSVAWLIDPMLQSHFFNAERMVQRALLYGEK